MPRKRIPGQKQPYQLEPGPMAAPLKAILERRKLAPRTVSVAAGLPSDTIRNILTGRAKRPRGEVAQALADYLGVSPAVLLGREPLPEQGAPIRPKGNVVAIPELEFTAAAEGSSQEVHKISREEACVWSLPIALFTSHRIDPSRCVITEAPEDGPGITRGDKVIVHEGNTLPSPPGLYIVWDGWAVGMAYLTLMKSPDGLKMRISRPGAAELVIDAAFLGILGRVVARWAWT